MTTEGAGALTITGHELAQSERANQTGRPPVVFAHGLRLPSSWTGRRHCSRSAGLSAPPSTRSRRRPTSPAGPSSATSPTRQSCSWPRTSGSFR
jgi:hypothetical protein